MEINPNLSEKVRADLEFVIRAQEGDEKAFEVLHNKYHNTIYYMILKMVHNTSDAEDLTMEAISKAFRNIHQYVPRYAFSSWLFKIATNNCIDFLRRKRMNFVDYESSAKAIHEVSLQNLHDSSAQLDPEEQLIKEQDLEGIMRIIDRLKPQYRRLVHLRYFKEYTYEEISIELDLPMGTVKAQLFRARELLQEHRNELKKFK